ncbi:MAG: glycosyltransferase family 2 protein [Cyclobacteriaceae bacterium]
MTNYKLTILIPTLYSRIDKLKKLIMELNYQIQSKPVQLLWIGDNKSMTTGEKRNLLLDNAKGEWICFIDDDDRISSNYINILLKSISDNPDKKVITFQGEQTTDGKRDLDFKYSVRYGRNLKIKDINGKRWKVMLPDHLCVWKKESITKRFEHKNLAEDHSWARAMETTYEAKDEVNLNDYLYFYDYNRETTECRR